MSREATMPRCRRSQLRKRWRTWLKSKMAVLLTGVLTEMGRRTCMTLS